MSENKEYISQKLENGSIQISEEVITSIAAMAAQEVEGVYGLGGAASDLAKLTKKSVTKDIRVELSDNDEISIDCYIIVLYGHSVVDVAKAVQEAIASAVESTTGRAVKDVNISVSGISVPKSTKK